MSPQDLKIGQAYFQVTYDDHELIVPAVDPMIYLGQDILDKDPSDGLQDQPWYVFQDPISYAQFGNAVNYKGDADLVEEGACVFSVTIEDLDSIFDLSGVVQELNGALVRARGLNS